MRGVLEQLLGDANWSRVLYFAERPEKEVEPREEAAVDLPLSLRQTACPTSPQMDLWATP